MLSATDRLEFAPVPDKGSLRAFALAVLAHILLIAALTWGVNWKRSDEAASFEAELWTSVPQQAAPKLVEVAPPLPAPAPLPTPAPAPPPPPPVKAPEVKVSPPAPDVDIALEQEKKRKLQQQLKQVEEQKAEKLRDKREAELQAKKEKELDRKKAKELQAKEDLATRKALEEARKAEARKQESKDQEKQKLAAAATEKQKQAAAASDKERQAAMKRMMGLAGATGTADAKGSAQRSSGPRGNSTTYGAIVRAAIKPNVVFTDEIVGNPMATIEVRLTLDGTVISQRLTKPSGNNEWDEAAIKAIIRTATMPRDIDGRIPDTTLILEMRPRN
ncbi:cell envelope integrity protein TolA [Polaromonas sp.]|uniref:cell envelope integrity protein TolA n=1 Tax=Polaromonas sp. TaxID=1869339 RepID=UPI0017DA2D84|nr:cell envelope integrity protein TolA [Polaromonas sp.]NML87034.1 cell envelope integrity protein TolA [Polaromonas sp.]